MFENRLKALLFMLATASAVILFRLVELQIVRADEFRAAGERALLLKPSSLPFVRGSILDRRGELLVSDEPSWEVRIDFATLAFDIENEAAVARGDASDAKLPPAVVAEIRRWRRAKWCPRSWKDDEVRHTIADRIAHMWTRLVLLSPADDPVSTAELRARTAEIYARVMRVRAAVSANRGFDSPVAEEYEAHPLLGNLDRDRQIAAREALETFPWLHVEPSARRVIHADGTALAHVVGRTGRVDAEDVAEDPEKDDPFACYRADERIGTSGVEWVAERRLRGRRGEITRDRDGHVIELVEAEDGEPIQLTIDAELQRRLYRLLGEAVEDVSESAGGAIAVLDVASREALALVSYPSYDPVQFDRNYPALRDDTERLPLLFRAVSNHYAPGSIVKPLVCLAGLVHGRITLETREECTGYLFPEQRDRWRCWEVHGTGIRKAHGSINLVDALTGSCNVFMYRLGERLGVDRMCSAFDMFGLGRTTGTGLREEVRGINPTPEWLSRDRHTPVTAGHARNFALGQGEVTVTPIQAANIMACYASGRYRPVTLIRSTAPTPEWVLPGTASDWDAIRAGIYGVVNDPDGTAYKYARFDHPRYVLCGKTGSATAAPWPTEFKVPIRDTDGGTRELLVPARTRQDAADRARFEVPGGEVLAHGIVATHYWPTVSPEGERHAHAWFAGYLQEVDADHRPDRSRTPRIAFAALLEFGGSGGRTTGPLARRIAAELIDRYGSDLDPDRLIDGSLRP